MVFSLLKGNTIFKFSFSMTTIALNVQKFLGNLTKVVSKKPKIQVSQYIKLTSKKNPSGFQMLGDLVGSIKNAPRDLSSNPKYLQSYGIF